MLRIPTAAAGILATLSQPAMAAPDPLVPTGNWGLDVNQERCAAGQKYMHKKRDVTVGYRFHPYWRSWDILIEVPGKIDRIEYREARITIGAETINNDLVITRSARPKNIIYEFELTNEQMAKVIANGRMNAQGWGLNVQVPLGDLAGRLGALDQCAARLLSKWGLPEADQQRIASFPVLLNSSDLVTSDQYPEGAADRRAIGRIEARIMVTEDGRASDCHLTRASGHADLDRVTCEGLLRGRFTPAKDHDGKPMKSPYVQTISFRMQQ